MACPQARMSLGTVDLCRSSHAGSSGTPTFGDPGGPPDGQGIGPATIEGMPPPIARAARLRADLDRLADAVAAATFSLASAEQGGRRRRRDDLITVLRSYLIPRLGEPDAPLLVVVAGPTGSGKSTIVNSIAESEVSRPGPLRPTTRQPVVWCHRRHSERYNRVGSVECEVVADDHPLLEDLTIVDTPDIDSYVAEHRAITVEILHHADIVVFLTSAQRYADAVPWEILRAIDRRGSQIVYVLNRLSRRASGAISDYTALLRRHGLTQGGDDPDVFPIQEQRVRGEASILPAKALSRLSAELRHIAAQRGEVLGQITARAAAYAVAESQAVADDVIAQDEERQRLEAVVDRVYADALEELTTELDRGSLIRTEVVERWSERVGTGDVARWIRGSASWLKNMADRLGGQPAAEVGRIESEARRELADAVTIRLERAARSVGTAWEVEEAGRTLLSPDLRTAGAAAAEETDAVIDRWLASLAALVEAEGPRRFRAARVASTGVNAAAVATILAVFAATGGLTGAEFGVAAGAAAAQQGILEHLLGQAAARSLAGSARDTFLSAVEQVFSAEAGRYRRVLQAASDSREVADGIRAAAEAVAVSSEEFHAQ
jgi:energy-coupling factor transporter ATP-binding protein EcfA2